MSTANNADAQRILDIAQEWSRAIEAKDADRIVEHYADETLLFDAIPPFITRGRNAIAELWRQCLPYFPDKVQSKHRDVNVEVSGDLAVLTALHHFVPDQDDHPCATTMMRVTVVYRRIDGDWKVVHEHVSVPFDPITNKAYYLQPGDDVTKAPAWDEAKPETDKPCPRVMPHLVCSPASEAIDFYKRAFAATELMRLDGPDGKIMHAALNINGEPVMMCDEYSEGCNTSPKTLKGSAVTIHLVVEDVDQWMARAEREGAKVVMPAADMFWGDRYGLIEDPFGHKWSIATPQKSLSVDEIKAALAAMPK